MNRKKRAVLLSFAVLAVMASLAATAFACTIFRGTMTLQGNSSTSTVKTTGLRTGMVQSVSSTKAFASRTNGSIKVSTGADQYGTKLPAGSYQVRYYNGTSPFGYKDHTHWQVDCMAGGPGRTLGTVSVTTAGTISGQPRTFLIGTSPPTTGTGEHAVCISNSNATYGNMVPLTVL